MGSSICGAVKKASHINKQKIMKSDLNLITNILIVLLLLICSTITNGQEFSFGRCPPFPTVRDFDAEKYSGRWYEYANYFAIFQLFGKCVTATYSLAPDDGYGKYQLKIDIVNRAISTLTGAKQVARGNAVLADPDNPFSPGELIVNFDSQPSFTRARSANYNVIDTDYDNFSIVYSCNNYGFLKSEILWILTRKRFPARPLISHLLRKIRGLGLDTRRLKKTDQKTCPAY